MSIESFESYREIKEDEAIIVPDHELDAFKESYNQLLIAAIIADIRSKERDSAWEVLRQYCLQSDYKRTILLSSSKFTARGNA